MWMRTSRAAQTTLSWPHQEPSGDLLHICASNSATLRHPPSTRLARPPWPCRRSTASTTAHAGKPSVWPGKAGSKRSFKIFSDVHTAACAH